MTDQHYHAVAATLVEALPYMRRFAGSVAYTGPPAKALARRSP